MYINLWIQVCMSRYSCVTRVLLLLYFGTLLYIPGCKSYICCAIAHVSTMPTVGLEARIANTKHLEPYQCLSSSSIFSSLYFPPNHCILSFFLHWFTWSTQQIITGSWWVATLNLCNLPRSGVVLGVRLD